VVAPVRQVEQEGSQSIVVAADLVSVKKVVVLQSSVSVGWLGLQSEVEHSFLLEQTSSGAIGYPLGFACG